jgi:hypothetical protein
VTTIPAAANAGVAVAYGAGAEVRGAAVQLALNLAVMVIAGLATLAVQRAAFTRRVSHALDRVARLTAGRGYRRR